ncbi:MAG: ABC transporter permease [Bacteroidota bacterium]
MFKNYIKISFRHLWKHKSHVLINLTGLGVGIGMCLLAYLTWKFDYDFDQFHTERERIYRVTSIKKSTQQNCGITSTALAEASEELTGVEAGILIDSRYTTITNGEDSHSERITFTQNDFLDWFNFPLLSGNKDLSKTDYLLITEKMARKYFGQANPLGETLTLYPETDYQKELQITGILKNTPLNSSIRFDFLTNIKNQFDGAGERINTQDWANLTDAVFLVLNPAQSATDIHAQLQTYLPVQNKASSGFQIEQFALQPLTTMAKSAHELRYNTMRTDLNDAMVWGTILMAITLLMTACFNFTNMMVSLAGRRLKEIGVRKVMGSSRQQLVMQLLVEGFIISAASVIIGLLMLKLILPYYNQMWRELDLQLVLWDNPPLIAFLAGMLILTTLLSAAYPAFYISAFSPHHIFRGTTKFSGANWFSRVLLGAQVASAMLGLVVGITFSQNATYQQETDLGFLKEGIQSVYVPDEQTFMAMEQVAQQSPQIKAVAGVQYHIGSGDAITDFTFRGETRESRMIRVGKNYLEAMEIGLHSGRSFNYDLNSDYESSILVNEQFAAEYFQNEDPVGQQILLFDTVRYTVVGVIQNFMQDGFFNPVYPLIVDLTRADRFRHLIVKTDPDQVYATRDYLERNWKQKFPYQPFQHFYQADFMGYGLDITNNVKNMTLTITLISVLLLIAGFTSLLAMDILKRLKEITIRRILGASASHVAFLLGNRFFVVVLINLVIGGFLGLWVAQMALDGIYDIHAGVKVQTPLICAAVMLFVVVLTILIRLFGVLQYDPAKTLSDE